MNTRRLKNDHRTKAGKKLTSSLAGTVSTNLFFSLKENEMLSLLIDETIKGVDIKTQYPDSYRALLHNPELRQVFLDTLQSLEAQAEDRLEPLPAGAKLNLDFLHNKQPQNQSSDQESWKISLQRTIQQLRDIFIPQKLAYRADSSFYEDSWFTLLREDVEIGGCSYSVWLECGISEETEQALSASLNVAMILEAKAISNSPLRATLRWGNYTETLTIIGEGRARFRDIPFSDTFDQQSHEILSGLKLMLEITPD
jgi:hypothetical protein